MKRFGFFALAFVLCGCQLTVNGGSGSGDYSEGTRVEIQANAPDPGFEFTRWTGDVSTLDDSSQATTFVTMPNQNVTVTANYREIGVEPAKNEYGIVAHVPDLDDFRWIDDLGLKWIRVTAYWDRARNPCSPSIVHDPAVDEAIRLANRRGVKVFLSLGSTPPCASSGNGDGGAIGNDVPRVEEWKSYMRRAVAHYRRKGIRHFGLWNEPNLDQFFEGDAATTVNTIYLPGIQSVRNGCRDAGANDCLAMGPELAHVGNYDQFMEDVLKGLQAAGVMFDIFTHHIYLDWDTNILDRDGFLNGLENRRFPFTRRSVKDVFTDVGMWNNGRPTLDFWLTETGHRATPPTGVDQLEIQKNYFENVQRTQVNRDWWTHSFFYELEDCYCEIDGFGIVRFENGAWLKKPAYNSLRSFALTPN